MEPQLELFATTLALLSLFFARKLAPAILAIIGIISWFNFDPVRSINSTHYHDSFHYYVGSKYFTELEYTKLYQCSIQASQEKSSFISQNETFNFRNLNDNSYSTVLASEVSQLACDKIFSSARWEQFKTDVTWFQDKLAPPDWKSLFIDHGFNASPFWISCASVLTNYFSPSEEFFHSCRVIEYTLLLLSFLLFAQSFGFLEASASMAIFGVGYLNDFSWTGSGFFRHDWLIFSLVALSLVKQKRIGWAIFFATLASALRIFPIVALGLILAKISMGFPKVVRFKSLGVFVLTLTSIALITSILTPRNSWQAFFENSKKHQTTRSRNSVSLIDTVDNISSCKYGTQSVNASDCDMENLRSSNSLSTLIKIVGLCLLVTSLVWLKSLELIFIAGFLILPWLTPLSSYYFAFLCLIGALSGRNKSLVLGVFALNWLLWFMAVGNVEASKIYLFAGALASMLGLWYIVSEILLSKKQLKT